jgi:hypothetical protein
MKDTSERPAKKGRPYTGLTGTSDTHLYADAGDLLRVRLHCARHGLPLGRFLIPLGLAEVDRLELSEAASVASS